MSFPFIVFPHHFYRGYRWRCGAWGLCSGPQWADLHGHGIVPVPGEAGHSPAHRCPGHRLHPVCLLFHGGRAPQQGEHASSYEHLIVSSWISRPKWSRYDTLSSGHEICPLICCLSTSLLTTQYFFHHNKCYFPACSCFQSTVRDTARAPSYLCCHCSNYYNKSKTTVIVSSGIMYLTSRP